MVVKMVVHVVEFCFHLLTFYLFLRLTFLLLLEST